MSWLEAIRTRLRLLFARGAAESRMDDEIRFHLEMETDRLVREEGLVPEEARRQAMVKFGGVERTKEELREGRGLAWLSGLRLDLKLGVRMILKYPVLTLAGVLALAVAVGMAASWFEFMTNITSPRLPLPDGDRIVQLRNRDLAAAANRPATLHDLENWREQLASVDAISAGTSVEYAVTTEDGRVVTLEGMRVTPSLFEVARVQPVLGRTLTEADLDAGAEPVAVIGYSAWQRVFDGDRSAVGEAVRLGSGYATVVGVMPEGFAFPFNQEIWTPLRESALNYGPGQGPPLLMVGRLAPGASVKEARAELAVIGQRTSAEFPQTHEHIRPDVQRFGRGSHMTAPARILNAPFLFFLLVVSANVATLLFARTATRQGEIAMRSALGASRRRLVLQLMAEALVLTSIAAALGLAAAHWGLLWGMDLFWQVQQERPPFWFSSGLSFRSVLYGIGLAFLAAIVIGGIPGFRATRRQLRDRLPSAGSGGAGMRFGAVATGVIIVQVALCVAFIPIAIMNGQALLPEQMTTTDFPAHTFLSARVTRDAAPAALTGISAQPATEAAEPDVLDEVRRRLAEEPGVLAATRATMIPGLNHGMEEIQLEGDSAATLEVRQLGIDPDFFDVMDARIVSGRPFNDADVNGAGEVAIVEQEWAEETFGGRNPIGRRFRYPQRPDEHGTRWYEVVGVVADIEPAMGPMATVPVYHPLQPRERASVQFYIRTSGEPAALVPRVADLVAAVGPDLALRELMPLSETWRPVQRAGRFFAVGFSVVALIILLFALIGIYALMSFTVARRAREIGVRAALGANPRRIIVSIFSRAMTQIGIGVLAGGALISLTVADSPEGIRLVIGVALAVVAVGLLACIVPAARALRIQPTEALRAE